MSTPMLPCIERALARFSERFSNTLPRSLDEVSPEEVSAAVLWVKTAYRQWKVELRHTPDGLKEDCRLFYWHSFGMPEWNRRLWIARLWLARKEGRTVPFCPHCEDAGDLQ